MPHQKPQLSIVLGALVIATLVVLGVYSTRSHEDATDALTNDLAPPAASRVESPGPTASSNLREGVKTLPPQEPAASEAPQSRTLLCLNAQTGEPLAGIALYSNSVLRAGPTRTDGRLTIEIAADFSKWTLWGAGWIPQDYNLASGPGEVRLVAADAKLEITLWPATAEYKVTRSVLQKRGPDPFPEGPWTPKLQKAGWDRQVAQAVPPGQYDIYLWVSKNAGAPQPYALEKVELPAGQLTKRAIDLVQDKPVTHERDS